MVAEEPVGDFTAYGLALPKPLSPAILDQIQTLADLAAALRQSAGGNIADAPKPTGDEEEIRTLAARLGGQFVAITYAVLP